MPDKTSTHKNIRISSKYSIPAFFMYSLAFQNLSWSNYRIQAAFIDNITYFVMFYCTFGVDFK